AELNRLRASAVQRPAAVRPVFLALKQYNIVHLAEAPFDGKVAIGAGDISDDLTEHLGIYIWTTDGRSSLPECSDKVNDEKNKRCTQKVLGRALDKKGCDDKRAEASYCYDVRRIDAILGNKSAGTFAFGGSRYEIRVTGWSSHVSGYRDSISLALYPAP